MLSGVSSEIVKQGSALVVPKALLHDSEQAASGRLRDQLASTVEKAGCSLTYVADADADVPAGAALLSRTQYTVRASRRATACRLRHAHAYAGLPLLHHTSAHAAPRS